MEDTREITHDAGHVIIHFFIYGACPGAVQEEESADAIHSNTLLIAVLSEVGESPDQGWMSKRRSACKESSASNAQRWRMA
ncbi:MAG: hypothetical protein WC556_12610 [Candidatus Methanoperedens sp.]